MRRLPSAASDAVLADDRTLLDRRGGGHGRGDVDSWRVISGIVALCMWVALAFWPARVAGRKGHGCWGYFFLILLFFPLVLVMAYVVQDRRVPASLRSTC